MRNGLSTFEIIISLAILAIVSTLGFIALNPGGELAKARNSQRRLHLESLMNGVRQNIADNSGQSFACASGSLPTSTKIMATGTINYDIGPCLVPVYLPTMPFDPSTTGARFLNINDYNTGYTITHNASTGEITLDAPDAELGQNISVVR